MTENVTVDLGLVTEEEAPTDEDILAYNLRRIARNARDLSERERQVLRDAATVLLGVTEDD